MKELRFAGAIATAVVAADVSIANTQAQPTPIKEFRYKYTAAARMQPVNDSSDNLAEFDLLPGDRVVFQVLPSSPKIDGRKATADLLYKHKIDKTESPGKEGFWRAARAEFGKHYYPLAVIPHTQEEKGNIKLDRGEGEVVVESIGKFQLGELWHDSGSLIFSPGAQRTKEEEQAYHELAGELARRPVFAGWRAQPNVNTITVAPGDGVATMSVTVTIRVYRGKLPPPAAK